MEDKKKSKRRSGITVEELMAQLNADPEYVRQQAEREAERQQYAREWAAAEVPLVAELAAVGITVSSVWDLVPRREPYPAAIPVLVRHLSRAYPSRVRDGIARALSVYDSVAYWEQLRALFHKEVREGDRTVASVIAQALEACATKAQLADVVEMLRDDTLGESRTPLIFVLKRIKNPLTWSLLREFSTHPMLGPNARAALKGRNSCN